MTKEIKQSIDELSELEIARISNMYLEHQRNNLQQENQLLKRNCNIGYEELNFYRGEYKKLKPVLDEIREYINNNAYYTSTVKLLKDTVIGEDLLQILDKVKE